MSPGAECARERGRRLARASFLLPPSAGARVRGIGEEVVGTRRRGAGEAPRTSDK